MARLTTFTSRRDRSPQVISIVERGGLEAGVVSEIEHLLGQVDWTTLAAAYGSATSVPAELWAAAVAGPDQRERAWWELWGDIHHQGTVYPATVSALPVLFVLTRWRDYPDRVEALAMIAAMASGDGTVAGQVREIICDQVPGLVGNWESEPPPVQRALLWLAGQFRTELTVPAGLFAILPAVHHRAWSDPVDVSDDDEANDRRGDLEDWALTPAGG